MRTRTFGLAVACVLSGAAAGCGQARSALEQEGGAAVNACTACHGGVNDDTGAPPRDLKGRTATTEVTVGAHTAHVKAGLLAAALDCGPCHLKPASIGSPGHLDGSPMIVWGTLATAGGAAPSWDRPAPPAATSTATAPRSAEARTCAHLDPRGRLAGRLRNLPRPSSLEPPCARRRLHGRHLRRLPPGDREDGRLHRRRRRPPRERRGRRLRRPPGGLDGRREPRLPRPRGPGRHRRLPGLPRRRPAGPGHDLRLHDLPRPGRERRLHPEVQLVPRLGGEPRAARDLSGTPPRPPWASARTSRTCSAARLRGAAGLQLLPPGPATVTAPGHLDGKVQVTGYTGTDPDLMAAVKAPGWSAGTSSCATSYCHGASPLLGGGAVAAPGWTRVDGSQVFCGSCHGLPPPITRRWPPGPTGPPAPSATTGR